MSETTAHRCPGETICPECSERKDNELDDLYAALIRMVRQTLNGHPIGHDAVVLAKRALKRANDGKMPDLACHCTACAGARRKP